MHAFYRCAALLGIALVAAQAQAVDFSFTPAFGTLTLGKGNSYSDTVNGLTITATAWSNRNKAEKFRAATLSVASDGLGVCTNRHCTTGALDNSSGGSDMILFGFSSAVSLQSLSLQSLGSDSDLSVWAGIGNTFSPNNKTSAKLGAETLIDTNNRAGIRQVSLAAFTGSYDWIAVAARIGQANDFATLKSLAINPVAQPVPEAATWMTMLAGLGPIGFVVSRRTHT